MASGRPFIDTDFAGDAAIGAGAEVQAWRYPVKWRRAATLHATPNLFAFIEADNISQGELGDCWLLAAFAVLADYPGHIQNLFGETEISAEGRYTVRLYDAMRGWEDVVIDDCIPCDRQGTPLFAQLKGKSGAIWALLLEKACAKFCGSYGALAGGSAAWAWQVLTGQMHQAHWARKDGKWTCFHLAKLREFLSSKEGAEKWRREGMKQMKWQGPDEEMSDNTFFETLAAYSQANFPIACAIDGGGMEEKRPDGLISRHEYSIVQVTCAHGKKLVQLRNPWGKGGEWQGAWSDNAPEWERYPAVAADLKLRASDDGVFWMGFEEFASIFKGSVSVCPVTLPCPRNSQQVASAEADGGRRRREDRCPQCRQPYTRSWVLLTSGEWRNLKAERGSCYLCLRATCRATVPDISIDGVHCQPRLSTAPPKAPRNLDLCPYGAGCYRRNPQHFRQCFHPSLLPPAPPCFNCDRSAASGFTSCCKACKAAPPNLVITVPAELGIHPNYNGLYQAVPGRTVKGAPVWQQKGGRGCWLWKGSVWMLAASEDKVGGLSGAIAGTAADMPAKVERGKWTFAGEGGWQPGLGITVVSSPSPVEHDAACNERATRETDLTKKADALLEAWRSSTR